MKNRWFSATYLVLGSLAFACGGEPGEPGAADSYAHDLSTAFCNKSEAKDVLIAQLVKDSWLVSYPLTRLRIGSQGEILAPSGPPELQGDLDLINSVPAARAATRQAVTELAGQPDYGMGGIRDEQQACNNVPAWTPSGETRISTTTIEVIPTTNVASWKATHKAFNKVCPLVKRFGNQDLVDPPGDGSTNLPPSGTVSSTGVTANAYGVCPAGTAFGTFCKLSYATGTNYMGRKCQYYYGSLRCLVY